MVTATCVVTPCAPVAAHVRVVAVATGVRWTWLVVALSRRYQPIHRDRGAGLRAGCLTRAAIDAIRSVVD